MEETKTKPDIFDQFDQMTKGGRKKNTFFVKKISVDLDERHLEIITRRQKMAGISSSSRGVVWDALELLAEKYGV